MSRQWPVWDLASGYKWASEASEGEGVGEVSPPKVRAFGNLMIVIMHFGAYSWYH